MELEKIFKLSEEELKNLDITDKFKLAEFEYKAQVLASLAAGYALTDMITSGLINESSEDFNRVKEAIVNKSKAEVFMLYKEDKELFEALYQDNYKDYEQLVGDEDENAR